MRPSAATVFFQSATVVEVASAEFTRSGSVVLAVIKARRSSDSSFKMIGPRPQARRRPAARRSWDGMTGLLLEIAACAAVRGAARRVGPPSPQASGRPWERLDVPRLSPLQPVLGVVQ